MYPTEEEIYRKAKKRVKAKKDFYWHFAVYLVIGAFFFAMNMFTFKGFWFYYPMLCWGIAIAFHYLAVFGLPWGTLSKEWEEKEIEREMNRRLKELPEEIDEPLELPEDELELRDFKKLRKEWDDKDFV